MLLLGCVNLQLQVFVPCMAADWMAHLFQVLLVTKDLNATSALNTTVSMPCNGTGPVVARVQVLRSSGSSAKTGITWAGQTFDSSTDGTAIGTRSSSEVGY